MPHAALQILVVEDDPIYSHFVATTLRDAGHDILVAGDAQTALRQARELPPDAVILDLRLPDESGYDVARALRRNVLAPEAVIIVLTADRFPHLDLAESVGVDLVLNKPHESELVIQLVDHVRQRRQLRLQSSK